MSRGLMLAVFAAVVCCGLAMPLDKLLDQLLKRQQETGRDGSGSGRTSGNNAPSHATDGQSETADEVSDIEWAIFGILTGVCELDGRLSEVEGQIYSKKIRSLLTRDGGFHFPSVSDFCQVLRDGLNNGLSADEMDRNFEQLFESENGGGDSDSDWKPTPEEEMWIAIGMLYSGLCELHGKLSSFSARALADELKRRSMDGIWPTLDEVCELVASEMQAGQGPEQTGHDVEQLGQEAEQTQAQARRLARILSKYQN